MHSLSVQTAYIWVQGAGEEAMGGGQVCISIAV